MRKISPTNVKDDFRQQLAELVDFQQVGYGAFSSEKQQSIFIEQCLLAAAGGSLRQPSRWFGSMSFSPGATIRAGEGVLVCAPNFRWEKNNYSFVWLRYERKLFQPWRSAFGGRQGYKK